MTCEDLDIKKYPILSPENCPVDGDGNFIQPPENDLVSRLCKRHSRLSAAEDRGKPRWEISENDDTSLIDNYVNETLIVGGAVINVHRLLGVHEQGKLQDLVGHGQAISGGDHPNFPAKNAFTKFNEEWHSVQVGFGVNKSFIGYDFGEILLDNGRQRYGVETSIRHDVSTIKLRQGCNSKNRATKIRVERSEDGDKWFGVAVLQVPDCEGMVTLSFRKSVPSRFWRIRPIDFNGGPEDFWAIQALQLIDYEKTNIDNIQDRIFLENRDRDYDINAIRIKGSYIPIDIQGNLSKFGFTSMFSGDEWVIEVGFSDTVSAIGRPFVIGDILQLPSETQFTASMKEVLRYLEVTDVAWSTNSYTPSWIPTMQRLLARPAMASQETQDILGKLTQTVDEMNVSDIDDGLFNKKYQDMQGITDTVKAKSSNEVSLRGADFADVAKISDEFYEWAEEQGDVNVARKIDRVRAQFGIDAMPPNGEPFTEGDEFPSDPKNGDYHRLTYTNIRTGIPARLHRYSEAKQRWIFIEKDRRAEFKKTKPNLQKALDLETGNIDPDDIFKS